MGEAACSSDYCPIRSLVECNAARIGLAISVWRADELQANTIRLPYCWIGSAGAANFNPSGDSGSNPGRSRIICERCGKFYTTLT